MRKTQGLIGLGLLGILSVGCASLESSLDHLGKQNRCSREQLEKKIKNGDGLIFGIEGLQPYSGRFVQILVESTAQETGCLHGASTGNWGIYMPLVKEAGKYRQAVMCGMGYSAGCREILSTIAFDQSVDWDYVVFIDPTYTISPLNAGVKVPENVKRLDVFQGENSGWLGGKRFTKEFLADPNKTSLEVHVIRGCDHLGMTSNPDILLEIRREMSEIYSRNRKMASFEKKR